MRRVKFLFGRVVNFENLLLAAEKAQRGKRFHPPVLRFNYNLEQGLIRLEEELRAHSYHPGPYHSFELVERKRRQISAAPYRDRVVHHALCNVIEPIFERSFIYHSYANRVGKGTHGAVDRYTYFARRYRYVLKCDISKYFPSIDHEILFRLIARKIGDPGVLWLVKTIIDASNLQQPVYEYFDGDDLFTPYERRRGLPLGNQTSQFFANVYLDPLDHFVKDKLRCKGYIRYVDDFVLFSNSKETLRQWFAQMGVFLGSLRLKLHPLKCHIWPVEHGVDFLGYRVYRDHRFLRRDNPVRCRQRLRLYQKQYSAGVLTLAELTQRVRSWIGHAIHADTYRLRSRLLSQFEFVRGDG